MELVALCIPWLLLLLLFVTVVMALKKKWVVTLLLTVVIITLNWWFECIPFRLCEISETSSGKVLKVMAFNIDGSSGDIKGKAPRLVSLIERYDPDIIFLAEYNEQDVELQDSLLKKQFDFSTCKSQVYFHYIYSKYPILAERRIHQDGAYEPGTFYAKILFGMDTINVYGCHLASNNYSEKQEHISPDSIESCSDLFTYVNYIVQASKKRLDNVEQVINDSLFPQNRTIVMGDMNDVGGSTAIRTLEMCGLKDAWWNGGFGYGATFHKPLPYRIDHIMFSDGLKLLRVDHVESEGLSDHDALYAEFEVK